MVMRMKGTHEVTVLRGLIRTVFAKVYILNLLVGGIATPLKNMKVSWDDYSQYMEK